MAEVISPLRAKRIWVLAVRGVDMDEAGMCDSLRRYEPDRVQRVFSQPCRHGSASEEGTPVMWETLSERGRCGAWRASH
jgi:hypothetical protein